MKSLTMLDGGCKIVFMNHLALVSSIINGILLVIVSVLGLLIRRWFQQLDKVSELDKRLSILEFGIKEYSEVTKSLQVSLKELSEILSKWKVEFVKLSERVGGIDNRLDEMEGRLSRRK